jgi:hypothetical protein
MIGSFLRIQPQPINCANRGQRDNRQLHALIISQEQNRKRHDRRRGNSPAEFEQRAQRSSGPRRRSDQDAQRNAGDDRQSKTGDNRL